MPTWDSNFLLHSCGNCRGGDCVVLCLLCRLDCPPSNVATDQTTTRVVRCPVLGLVVPCLCRRCCRCRGQQQSRPPESHDPPSDDAFAAYPLPAQTRTTNKKAKTMMATDGVWAACTSDGVITLRGAMGGQRRKWNTL
jgi:hypothetical protein